MYSAWGNDKGLQNFDRKRQLETPSRKLEDNIKIDLRELG
jgi:hypothetical protein